MVSDDTVHKGTIENVIRTWLARTVEDQRVAQDGLGDTVRRCVGFFYADDGMVGSRNPDWMKYKMNVLVELFRRYGLVSNAAKSHKMTCEPRELRAGISEEAMALKCTGMGYSYRVRLRRRIPCP